jgi:hypothetical protein
MVRKGNGEPPILYYTPSKAPNFLLYRRTASRVGCEVLTMGWWLENSSRLLKLCQQALHFRAGMLIALPISRGNTPA